MSFQMCSLHTRLLVDFGPVESHLCSVVPFYQSKMVYSVKKKKHLCADGWKKVSAYIKMPLYKHEHCHVSYFNVFCLLAYLQCLILINDQLIRLVLLSWNCKYWEDQELPLWFVRPLNPSWFVRPSSSNLKLSISCICFLISRTLEIIKSLYVSIFTCCSIICTHTLLLWWCRNK